MWVTCLRRLTALVFCAACVGIWPGWAAATPHRRAGRCDAHRSHVKETRRVLVWSAPDGIDEASGGNLTGWYACARPNGTSIQVGENDAGGEEYGGDVETTRLRIAGLIVTDLVTSGYASQEACFKYEPTNPLCASATTPSVHVANVANDHLLRQALPGSTTGYTLTLRGGIAWEAPQGPATYESPIVLRAVGFNP